MKALRCLILLPLLPLPVLATTAAPSFPCSKAASSAAKQVCSTPTLAALDRQLAQVYRQARGKAGKTLQATLKAEQRGWVKGRDDCWPSRVSAIRQRLLADVVIRVSAPAWSKALKSIRH